LVKIALVAGSSLSSYRVLEFVNFCCETSARRMQFVQSRIPRTLL